MTEQKQFTFGRVENIVQKSKEIGSNAISVVGVRNADVMCACGHQWNAHDRSGLRNHVGGVRITCPSCGAEELVHMRSLSAS